MPEASITLLGGLFVGLVLGTLLGLMLGIRRRGAPLIDPFVAAIAGVVVVGSPVLGMIIFTLSGDQ